MQNPAIDSSLKLKQKMPLFDLTKLTNVLFIDLETVAAHPTFDQLDERLQLLWEKKARQLNRDEDVDAAAYYEERAGIYAEFGKIVCIGMGFFLQTPDGLEFRCKSMHGHDEKALLEAFSAMLQADNRKKFHWLCAHNGREFDFPYLCRRMLVNKVPLPTLLEELSTKKPWEVPHLDTQDMWKFGDWKSYTSLDLLAAIFGIPSSKDGIDGSMVNTVYHKDNNLETIARYCARDVVVLARLFQCLNGMDYIPDAQVKMVE